MTKRATDICMKVEWSAETAAARRGSALTVLKGTVTNNGDPPRYPTSVSSDLMQYRHESYTRFADTI